MSLSGSNNSLKSLSLSTDIHQVHVKLHGIASKRGGLTLNQIAWIASGDGDSRWVDERGYCHPKKDYESCQAYMNYKRRVSDITSEKKGKYKQLLKKGIAHCNPYSFAAGLYSLGTVSFSSNSKDSGAGYSSPTQDPVPVVINNKNNVKEAVDVGVPRFSSAADILAELNEREINKK